LKAELLIGALPFAAYLGWKWGRRHLHSPTNNTAFSASYYAGVNYLVNEQTDKAIEAFIQLLDLSPETVDTTMTLGNLFRRRGQVDKAIQIHQNLIARPSLTKEQRSRALLALGEDYLSAGVFDRAENLFHELIEMGTAEKSEAQRHLIWIFEREKDWDRAIDMAKKLQFSTNQPLGKSIAHYSCEKAQVALSNNDSRGAMRALKNALNSDPNCVRASILCGRLEVAAGRYKPALRAFKQVQYQGEAYLPEVISDICACYIALGQESQMNTYLENLLQSTPSTSVILAKAHRLKSIGEGEAAASVVTDYLKHYPSIRGIKHLIEYHLARLASPGPRKDLLILHGLVEQLLAQKPIYRCKSCGFSSKTLLWQCPSCHEWSVIKPIQGLEGE
jgi:lipopolysaccharide biosynthesis regulator YciM